MSIKSIGIQLYTLRSLMKQDVTRTLESVATLGYKEVQFAGYFDQTPEQIKSTLDRLGLTSPAAHVSLDELKDELPKLIQDAKTIGHKYIVCPYIPEDQRSISDYKSFAAFFNEVGKKLKSEGLIFAYHNHAFEFDKTDGQIPYDILLENTNPEFVNFEMDLYWISKAGANPMHYFRKYPGRFLLFHVKDMGKNKEIVDVGQGVIDFKSIFSAAKFSGVKHFFVEHDNPQNALLTAKNSIDYLKKLRY